MQGLTIKKARLRLFFFLRKQKRPDSIPRTKWRPVEKPDLACFGCADVIAATPHTNNNFQARSAIQLSRRRRLSLAVMERRRPDASDDDETEGRQPSVFESGAHDRYLDSILNVSDAYIRVDHPIGNMIGKRRQLARCRRSKAEAIRTAALYLRLN